MENSIRVLKVEPGKVPYVKDIEDDYMVSQKEVCGDIDCFNIDDRCVVVYNVTGKVTYMEPNRRIYNDIIWGPFFICAEGEEGELLSLSEEQIAKYSEQFAEIEQFTGQEQELEPRIAAITF